MLSEYFGIVFSLFLIFGLLAWATGSSKRSSGGGFGLLAALLAFLGIEALQGRQASQAEERNRAKSASRRPR